MTPTAIILAGGKGTRLAHVLAGLPKPLAPVLGRPFLLHLLDSLANAGLERAVLSLGHEALQIERAIEGYGRLGLDWVTESEPLGTAGALRHALNKAEGDLVLALNGDSFTPFDLARFRAFHEKGGWSVSLAAVAMADASRFGRIDLAPDGKVRAFMEKQAGGSGVINAGIYLIERGLLQALPTGKALSFETDVLEPLARQGRLGAFLCPGPFIDIGTPESYAQADGFFQDLKKSRLGVAGR
ncbi:Nucleoside-diphosphate-sugar pyrophosphorylase family protein [Rhodospirillaceae bacterium LM-1]|nr:Nucleoside-diphosphate-sugar pyrophosphorylase family protein [Rhodospirillaceae bacterium LM-1]